MTSPLALASWHSAWWAEGSDFSGLGLANNDAVATWPDEIGTKDFAQATSGLRPLYKSSAINGHPGVEFDGTDDFLRTAAFTEISQPNTVVVVYRLHRALGATEQICIIDGIADGKRHALGMFSNGGPCQIFSGASVFNGAPDTAAHLYIARHNSTSTKLLRDGNAATGDGGTNPLTGLTLGARYLDTGPAPVQVAFLGIVDGSLTTQQEADLLAWAREMYEVPYPTPERNYLRSDQTLNTAAGTGTLGSGDTTSSTFVVARTFTRTADARWEGAAANWGVQVRVTAMTTPYEMRMRLQRLNSSDVVQSSSDYFPVWNATGYKGASVSWASGEWAATDKLRIVWEHRRPSGTGNKNGTVATDTESFADAVVEPLVIPVGPAEEVDEAQIVVLLGVATEVDEALPVTPLLETGPLTVAIGIAEEVDEALAITPVLGDTTTLRGSSPPVSDGSRLLVGDFVALQEAVGGWIGMTGRIPSQTLAAFPDRITGGATWRRVIRETGKEYAWGVLKQPVHNGGAVDLSARGPAELAQTYVGRYFGQSRSYQDLVSADSDPHDYNSNKNIEVRIKQRTVVFRPRPHDYAGGEQAGFVFQGYPDQVGRVAFVIRKPDGNDSGWELVLYGGSIDNNGFGAALSAIETWGLGAANPDGTEIDYELPGGRDIIRLSLRKVGADDLSETKEGNIPVFRIGQWRVNGRILDDDVTTSDVMRDVCSEIGVGDRFIRESAVPAFPYDVNATSYLDIIADMCLLTGWPAIFIRLYGRTFLYFGPFGMNPLAGAWRLTDPRMARDLLPQDRYSQALVVSPEADGRAEREFVGVADPNPLGRQVMYPEPFVLDDPVSDNKGQALADRLAGEVAHLPPSGALTFDRVSDESGIPHSHLLVMAGDTITVPWEGATLPVETLEHFDAYTVTTHPEGVPMWDMIQARRSRRRAARRKT